MAVAAWADLASLANDLSKAEGTGITLAAADIIQQSAQRIQSTAQSLAPIKSGRLRQSISIRYPEPLKAIVGPQVEYGKYQEFGTGTRGEFPTKPYEIRPKGGRKFLSFTVNGKKVVVRRVTHPGEWALPGGMRHATVTARAALGRHGFSEKAGGQGGP